MPIKGFDTAVRALPGLLAGIPDARLVLVGNGPERARLEDLAVALRVRQRLTITGAVDDVPGFLAAADILGAPSRNEGMGRVLVEAMALGVPVVAANVGGVSSVIQPGISGSLVSPNDHAALASAMILLLKDRSRLEAYRGAGLDRAEEFSLAVMERELLALYRQVILEKGLSLETNADAPSPVLATDRWRTTEHSACSSPDDR